MFGKGEKPVEPQDAIQEINSTIEMLSKKSEYIESQIDKEMGNIKKNMAGGNKNSATNKRAAMQALKRKKNLESQLTKVDNTITTLEFQVGTIQEAKSNAQVLQVMNQGTKALSSVQKQLNIDKVDDIRDKMQEQQDLANEISEAIATPFDSIGGEMFDDDDLESELAGIMQEDFDSQMLEIPNDPAPSIPAAPINTPAVPTTALPSVPQAQNTELDKELDEMAGWLA